MKPLAVVLTMDNTAFDKGVHHVHEQITGLAKEMSEIPRRLAAIGNLPLHGLETFMKPLSGVKSMMGEYKEIGESLFKMIPGIGLQAEAIFHPIESAENAMRSMLQLSRDAKRIGVDPQFLKGMQLAAGPESEALEKGMAKLLKFQGQLKIGGDELMAAGGSSAAKLMKKWDMPEEFAKAKPEEALGIFQKKLLELKDPALQVAFATDFMSKSATGALNVLRDPGAIEKWTARVKELHIAEEDGIAISKAWSVIQKDLKLQMEAAEERMVPSGGLMSMGGAKIKMGDLSGLHDIEQGISNWFATAFGDAATEVKLPPEVGRKAFKDVEAAMKAAGLHEGDKDFDRVSELKEHWGAVINPRTLEELTHIKEKIQPDAIAMSQGDQFTDLIKRYKEMTQAVGKSAEELEVKRAKEELEKIGMQSKLPVIEKEIHARYELQKANEESNRALQESIALSDEESQKMERWAAAKAERTQHPFAKLLGLDNDQDMMGGLATLEKQFNTNPAVQLAGAYGGGSREAYSIMANAGASGGQGDLASRVQAVKDAIDEAKRAIQAGNSELAPLLRDILDSLPGAATN